MKITMFNSIVSNTIIVVVLMLMMILQVSNGWVHNIINNNNNIIKNYIPTKDDISKVTAIVTISATILSTPLIANANGFDFTGSYSDPKHPNCLREIVVNGHHADVTGTDGSPGCPEDGSGIKWKLEGIIQGNTILVDFAPKGGPTDLKGMWEKEPKPGIRWPDGNIWTIKN